MGQGFVTYDANGKEVTSSKDLIAKVIDIVTVPSNSVTNLDYPDLGKYSTVFVIPMSITGDVNNSDYYRQASMVIQPKFTRSGTKITFARATRYSFNVNFKYIIAAV